MQKKLTILLFLFSLITCLSIGSNVIAQSKNKNQSEGVESVTFDKTQVTLACPWTGIRSKQPCPPEERKIMISTFSPSAEKNSLTYYYFPSAGKIMGEGANVVWDFSGVKPGTYSITIGVGKNGSLKGNFITKMVTAEFCGCHPPCSCPSLSITGPTELAKAGDTLIFTANLSGGTQDRAAFNWMVLAGTIISGQGTSQILVKTSKEMKDYTVTATVEIGGLCADCPQTAASASVDFNDKSSSVNDDKTIESVNLELDKLSYCQWSRKTEGECSKKRAIEVSVVSPKAEKEGLDYYYLVSGGEIIGKGSKVIWDFSNARMGKYSITVGVGNNSAILGKTVTKSFDFEACDECLPSCSCPQLSISGPTAPAKRGDTLIFRANLSGGTQDRAVFNWKISDGEIIQGKGTSEIFVKTSPKMKSKKLIATVEVGGLCSDCPQTTGSASADIAKK